MTEKEKWLGPYYTYWDVDRQFRLKRSEWPARWTDVRVYSDEIIIVLTPDAVEEEEEKFLAEQFGGRFSTKERMLVLDYDNRKLKITFEKEEEGKTSETTFVPLFKEYFSRIPNKEDYPKPFPGPVPPVIAFHSYKGGVGRTLALIAFLNAMSGLQKRGGGSFQALVVDADTEAPGLTWLAEESGHHYDMDLYDILAILHQEEEINEKLLNFIAKKVSEVPLRIPTSNKFTEHYFIPSYRKISSLWPIDITPEHLISVSGREWWMTEWLVRLGKTLGVDAVLVDLKAGLSELAAPLLLDPRVRKVFVTSTSLQSVRGTEMMLQRIFKDRGLRDEDPQPLVLVNKVTKEWENAQKRKLEERLLSAVGEAGDSEDEVSDDYALEPFGVTVEFVEFAPSLLNTQDIEDICSRFSGTALYSTMTRFASDWLLVPTVPLAEKPEKVRENFLNELNRITSELVVAEKTMADEFLTTNPLRNLVKKFYYSVPVAAVLGAKGSGKTFVYLQLLRAGTWERFVADVEKKAAKEGNEHTYVVPFLRPKNLGDKPDQKMDEHLENINRIFGFSISRRDIQHLTDELIQEASQPQTETKWKEKWLTFLVQLLGKEEIKNIDHLQLYLKNSKKRILFIVDGLEEIFSHISTSSNERAAVRALVQGVLNELRSIPDCRIGMLVFIRQDVAMNAIEQNFTHFREIYSPYALNWTHVEALRLTLWLCQKAKRDFYKENIPLDQATEEWLQKKLEPLWGLKLGNPSSREAVSSNWVVAALSDLNSQLQARDIVRFLKYSSEKSKYDKSAHIFSDRFLTPTAIRKSVQECSREKISEIKQEMKELVEIFDKLEALDEDKKRIPFQLEGVGLTLDEAKLLDQQGFLRRLNEEYYMPEIIRHGLGFKLQKGARPKVFALLKREPQKSDY